MDNKSPQELTEVMIKIRVAVYLDLWAENLGTLYPVSNEKDEVKPKIQVPQGAAFRSREPECGEDSKWVFFV